MKSDEEGFLYPNICKEKCIDCGLCEKVCPVINQAMPTKPLKVFAAKNLNEEIRMLSSSGGIFTMLAEQTIKKRGVVFGCRFDENWEAVHSFTETMEGISAFRGSKYVQSRIEDNYLKVEAFLKENRAVLFSGTPCQVAGLHRFLRKNYDNLTTVDVVCHGVPSPLVFRDYLKTIISSKGASIENRVSLSLSNMPILSKINFRDKTTGWKKFGFVIHTKLAFQVEEKSTSSFIKGKESESVLLHETLDKNVFMQGFLKNIYLRPSCYACPAKSGKSQSDITIADFWGIARYFPAFDDDKGVGLVMVNTSKGKTIYDLLSKDDIEVSYEQGFSSNPSLEHSCAEPKQKTEFWSRYPKEGTTCIMPIVNTMRPPFASRCGLLVKQIIKRIIRIK